MTKKILFIEDDMGLAMTVADMLSSEGYDVTHLDNGDRVREQLSNQHFDLILLDIMLKGRSGFEICDEIRIRGFKLPILLLTAMGQTTDKVKGLKLGADDYMTKPFEFSELLARIEALIRRSNFNQHEQNYMKIGNIEIDFRSIKVSYHGKKVDMSSKEFQLLKYLVINIDRPVSREEILENVWGYDSNITTRTIDTHIGWLRNKLEIDSKNPQFIITVFGFGYKFVGQAEQKSISGS